MGKAWSPHGLYRCPRLWWVPGCSECRGTWG